MPYTPTVRVAETLLAVQRQVEAMLDLTPVDDAQTTINSKYSVGSGLTLTAGTRPKILWFGVGTNGFYNVEEGNLSEPREVLGTNMDLYSPLPIRCVPIENDLSPADRANYRMREVRTINSEVYVLYWLKKLTLIETEVALTLTDEAGDETEYVIDYANLAPTPPDPGESVVDSGQATISASASTLISVTGAEILEAVNVIYEGDTRYAKISELGLYMGEDKTHTGLDAESASFSYTEAAFAQLALHKCWLGNPLPEETDQFTTTYRISDSALILQP